MNIKISWFSLMVLGLVLLVSVPVYGYKRFSCGSASEYEYQFWAGKDIPIKYWISNEFNAKEKREIRRAFTVWGTVSGSKLRFVEVSKESQAKVRLVKSSLAVSAQTVNLCSELESYFISAVVTFSKNFCWFQDRTTKFLCNINPLNVDVDTYSVALHEIGHVIGLDHPFGNNFPGSNRTSVVEPIDENEILNQLYPDDINAAQDIYPPNRPPIANAGPDQTVQVGSIVQLNGSGSSDPDGDSLKYSWKFIKKPSGSKARLSKSNIANPTFKADKKGEYLLELKVNDGRGGTATDQVKITAQICRFKHEIFWIGQPPEPVSETIIDPSSPPPNASVRFSLCVQETPTTFKWIYTVYNIDFRTQQGVNDLSGLRVENTFVVPFTNQFGPPDWIMQGFVSEWEWDIPSGQGIQKGSSAQFGFETSKDFEPTVSDCCYWVHSWDATPMQVDILGDGRMIVPAPIGVASTAAKFERGNLVLEKFTLTSNPAKDLVRFKVEGTGIAGMRVQIFNLAGHAVYNSDFIPSNTLEWNLNTNDGQIVANGVYLYIITARRKDGTIFGSQIKKLVILR